MICMITADFAYTVKNSFFTGGYNENKKGCTGNLYSDSIGGGSVVLIADKRFYGRI